MSIFVDIAVVAIIAFSIIMGYKKGLIGVAFKIASFLIAIVLAFVLSKPIANYIVENTKWDDNLQSTIQSALEAKDLEKVEVTEEKQENMPDIITEYVADQIKEATAETQNEIAKVVATNLTNTIINAIVFIGIFLVARILLFFLKFLAEAIAEIPIIKQFNEVGGLLYGVLKGFFVVYLFFAIVSLIAPVLNISGFLEIIQSSFLGSMLYNNNLLLKILF